ncbi:MAG TPA: hypothetical protein VM734_35230 [Kofleriaceae bacterium]|jgi:hypothetical protein|nr:hypothetical protein [Kofleriaceae bacterium]
MAAAPPPPTFPVAPGPGRADCPHAERVEGVCLACGHCEHDIVLNGACLSCGTTEIDAVARSPRPELIPPDRLTRR